MTKVLVTGVTGFTGQHLAPRLADAGYTVHGTVQGEGIDTASVSELHQVDLGDFETLARVVREVEPEKVVHLAAISFVAHSDVNEMYRTNIVGTRNLLEALASAGSPPDSIILASSANVYGNARDGMLDESVPPSPVNDYGITKAAGEVVAAAYRNRLPLIVVRPFNYTGRGQSSKFLIPKIVAHARAGARDIELGNIDVARDFSDVRAVADAYVRLLDTPSAISETFNVCSGQATSLREVLDLARTISGSELAVRVSPELLRKNEVKSLWGSAARLEKAIGALSMPPLEATLRWMIED